MDVLFSYLRYFELVWRYIPYIIYITAFVTLLPKSLHKMKVYTTDYYKLNCVNYHRCYAPDICCHTLRVNDSDSELEHKLVTKENQKPRKIIRRSYPKKVTMITNSSDNVLQELNTHKIARQGLKPEINSFNHVNQIAKMFENGGKGKKGNHVKQTDDYCMNKIKLSKEENANRLGWLHKENVENQMPSHNDSNYKSEYLTPQINRCDYTLMSPMSYTLAYNDNTPSKLSPMATPTREYKTSEPSLPIIGARTSWLNMKTSLEDIFAAIASNAESANENLPNSDSNMLPPVTSIEDILSQRRLSRTLSAYSISDLLINDETITATSSVCHPEEVIYTENFILRPLNTAEWC